MDEAEHRIGRGFFEEPRPTRVRVPASSGSGRDERPGEPSTVTVENGDAPAPTGPADPAAPARPSGGPRRAGRSHPALDGEGAVTGEDSRVGDGEPAPETTTDPDAGTADVPDPPDDRGGPDGGDGPDPCDGTDVCDVPDGPGRRPKKRRAHRWPAWVELPALVALGLTLVLLGHVFVAQPFVIPSASMENTLRVGDRVLVNKLAYRFADVRRGDVVVFDGSGSFSPEGGTREPDNPFARAAHRFGSFFGLTGSGETDFVKRVIGIGGDRVICCDDRDRIMVNGVALDESSYLFPGDRPSEQQFDIIVPRGRLWVMGDHRSNSADSRTHLGDPGGGFVPEDRVIGRVQWVIWPLGGIRSVDRPATFSQPGIGIQVPPAERRG